MVEGKYSDVEVWGEARDRALAGVQKQMSAWGLTMPDVKLLMLNFGLDDFEKTGLTEFWVANEEEAGCCGKFLFSSSSFTVKRELCSCLKIRD